MTAMSSSSFSLLLLSLLPFLAQVPSALPFLIVGQGLAGTAVAWRLWEQGLPFLIVDPDEPQTSSKVAAGLITPITGMRLNLSWRIDTLLPEAQTFYEAIEARLGGRFYHSVPHVRLFKNERELKIWSTRREDPALQPWLDSQAPAPLVDPTHVYGELGGFQQRPAGWLDTAAYLAASREHFKSLGMWLQDTVAEEDLDVSPDRVRWQGRDFSHVILCRGWLESRGERYFPWLKFDAARGVIVTLTIGAEFAEHRILNRGGWMLPRPDGTWRAGSTYEFDFDRPLEPSVEEVRAKLSGLLRTPFEITSAQAGIRPIIKRHYGAVGSHPRYPRVAVLNGLGSKGVLRSPAFARMLVDHLMDRAPLEAAVDVLSHE